MRTSRAARYVLHYEEHDNKPARLEAFMLFRQLFDVDSSTYTYLLADEQTREAVVIDPVIEQFERDRTLIDELRLELTHVLETHVHADHVTGAGLLRKQFAAKTVVSERAGVVCPDRQIKQGDFIRFGRYELTVRETPGHTSGCVSYVCADPAMVFTGDALLIRGCGRTDFQHGDAAVLYRSIHSQIFTLPPQTLVYPAHDYKGRTVSSVAEEMRFNARLGAGRSLGDFTQLMAELKLPYPKKLEVSLPANARCGVAPAASPAMPDLDRNWAPLAITELGVPEVNADWVHGARAQVVLLDVREPDEFRGELGHIAGAKLVPLGTLSGQVGLLPPDASYVLVCRSGGRSGRAVMDLIALGYRRVASLRGGMLAWKEQGLPVEGSWIDNRQG